MKDCTISKEQIEMLTGRPRTLCYAVQLLQDETNEQNLKSKQDLLDKAIVQSYHHMRDTIVETIKKTFADHAYKSKVITLLFKIAVAKSLGKEWNFVLNAMDNLKTFDFVNAGIFHIKRLNEKKVVIPTEPLGLAIVHKLLDECKNLKNSNPIIYKISQIIHDNNNKQKKGSTMEEIVAMYLKKPGKMEKLAEIAETNGCDKDWIKGFEFDKFGTAKQLGIDDTNTEYRADLEIFKRFSEDKIDAVLLRPNQNLGPDLVGLKKIGDKKRMVCISVKILKKVTQEESHKAHSQMNPNHFYFSNRHTTPTENPRMKNALSELNKIKKKMDLDKVLMMNIIIPAENNKHKFTKLHLKEGQALITLTLPNIAKLIEDEIIVSVFNEFENATEESSEQIENILHDELNDEEDVSMTEDAETIQKKSSRKSSETDLVERESKKIRVWGEVDVESQ
ncbi:MAG: hypothetical protein H0U27_03045, partial [Nitrosopumilus sp.]|nr:hypothetical protein [Nitrosopumilus sp.]